MFSFEGKTSVIFVDISFHRLGNVFNEGIEPVLSCSSDVKKLNGRQTVPLSQEGGMREPTARFLVLRKKRQVHCSLQWSSLHGDRQVLQKKINK